jgi:hypothetical protein
MKKNLIFVAIVGLLLTILIGIYRGAGTGDFIAYWSAMGAIHMINLR